MNDPLVFLKLGGSLITNKHLPDTLRPEVLARVAGEIARALHAQPRTRLLIGHGSGSFGHTAALRHNTRAGAHNPEQWRGYATVAAAAGKLNRLVEAALRAAGVPVINLRPSASAVCTDGALHTLATAPIAAALRNGLVPLVCGDVAIDSQRGATIVSTEDVFVFLAAALKPTRILLAGSDPGVLDRFPNGAVIARLTPAMLASHAAQVQASQAPDVTGGMASKVQQMFALLHAQPTLAIQIFSGTETGSVYDHLVEIGTNGTSLVNA